MTKPVLFLQWNTGCNGSDNRPVEEEILIQPFIATLSIIAFLLNTIAILIFFYQPKRSVMRFNLIILSVAESLFNFIVILCFLLTCADLMTISLPRFSAPSFGSIEIVPRAYKLTIIFMDIMVCVRNWCNLLIAASRAEVIAKSIGKERFFRKSSIYAILGTIFLLSTGLAILRHCDVQLLVCENSNNGTYFSEERLYLPPVALKTITLIWFFIQCIIPWTGVVVCSSIMTVAICRNFKKRKLLNVSASSSQKRRNTALRTVLGLALTFTICELPTFLFTIVSGIEISGMEKYKVLINISNSLIVLDSVINFLVYAAAMPQFREDFCKLVRLQGLGRQRRHNIYSPSNYMFSKANFNQLVPKRTETVSSCVEKSNEKE